MSRAICTNDRIMHIARNPRQVHIARKVQKLHIPRNMYPNGQNAMLCLTVPATTGNKAWYSANISVPGLKTTCTEQSQYN